MSIESPSPSGFKLPRRTSLRYVETQVSLYDQVNGHLIALLVVWGFLVLAMFLIWANSGVKRILPPPPIQTSVVLEDDEGEEDDLDDPSDEDFPDDDTPELANALDAIPDALASIQALATSGDALKSAGRRGNRGSGVVPQYKRWIIQYEAESMSTYARQLSFFGIDIGVFYKANPRIFRVQDPAGRQQMVETSRAEEAKTLRFMHKERRMIRWDEEMARRAGVSLEPDGVTCQFYSPETRLLLRQVEAEALHEAGRELKSVRNTYFKVEPEGSGFVFRVVNIVYR